MSLFNLPDLGEGLPDAEIHEWYVKVGDQVTVDQPLVAMETAKAVVDVPAPQSGVIAKLYGQPGDIIKTGQPLIEFVGASEQTTVREDQGTVVGSIEATGKTVQEQFTIGRQTTTHTNAIKTTPAVRALAKKLKVDLAQVIATGAKGTITQADVEKHATTTHDAPPVDFIPLKGTRRTMATLMSQSHQQVAPVTIYDDAVLAQNIAGHDITVHLIQSIIAAAKQEPALNAWYDGASNSRCLKTDVNLGLAVDSDDGLFVPVIKAAQQLSAQELRQTVDQFKQQVRDRSLDPANLKQATITLSNFGKFAGRYANPMIVPPTVAILGVGRLQQQVVAVDQTPEVRWVMPLSLTFDHRATTGGEATRFLGVIMDQLTNLFNAP